MEDNPRLAPIDPAAPYALRMMLIRRYWYLTLKISNPIISESGHWEASWNGGQTQADTQATLLTKVLEAFEDCGDENHLWETTRETLDRASGQILLTQRRVCAFCDAKERVITIYRPDLISTEIPDTGYPHGHF
jgi:hypothetical protein